jgi:tRNA(Ile)-lysidine synthase
MKVRKMQCEIVPDAITTLLKSLVKNGESLTIAVAYSGGLDSTVLLHSLARSTEFRAGFRVKAIHIHHGLSANADSWLERCSVFAQSLDISLEAIKIGVLNAKSHGVEDAARRARYAAFAGVVADHILLAHHADDQAESVMLNLLRGTGILGLGGMPRVRSRYIRPFLELPQSALRQYAADHKLSWCEDESNTDARYTRNFLRAEIFPKLRARYPATSVRFTDIAKRASNAQGLLNELAIIDLGGGEAPYFPIPKIRIRTLSPDRVANALRVALNSEGLQAPNSRRLLEFVRQIHEARADRHPRLATPSWTLTLTKGNIWLNR